MPYRHATEGGDHSDFASGRVLWSLPGRPAFPARLASEVFQRCMAVRGLPGPVSVYDPCCGVGHLLTLLAFLHGDQIASVVGSDVDEDALAVARRNLALKDPAAMRERMAQRRQELLAYGKRSHAEALASAAKLLKLTRPGGIPFSLFRADATARREVEQGLQGRRIDLVITDLPYGRASTWQLPDPAPRPPADLLLEALRGVLRSGSVIVIISDKSQRPRADVALPAGRFRVGRRQVTMLRSHGSPADG